MVSVAEARVKFRDPRWFVPRLKIIARGASIVQIRHAEQPDGGFGLTPEQWQIIDAISTHKYVLILKPRQIGSTTITQACAFHYGWKCRDPISILTLAHESGACGRVNSMLRTFWRGLPKDLRPELGANNQHVLQFRRRRRNKGVEEEVEVTFRQYMAGGRGQGRSYTYDWAIFTEMGLYPQGSASLKGGTEADRDAVASVLSTMHDGPHKRIIVESTGDGPSGMFYDMVRTARTSPEWAFLFFRWYDFPHYEIDPPDDWRRSEDEIEIGERIRAHLGCGDATIDRKLAWRRHKLVDEAYSQMRFRREYPETWEEPFMLTDSAWFDTELLNRVLEKLTPDSKKDLRVYHQVEAGHRYFIGMDTSGGTGNDFAVIVVLRDDFEVCAVWSSNRHKPHQQAEVASRLSAFYSPIGEDGEPVRAPILVEKNKYGGAVIKELQRLKARLWTDRRGKFFWMQGGKTSETKVIVYSHAQKLVNHMRCCTAAVGQPPMINDPRIVHELMVVREDEGGNIQAPPGDHDDHADAYVLALWCARGHYTLAEDQAPTQGQAQHAVRRRLRGTTK